MLDGDGLAFAVVGLAVVGTLLAFVVVVVAATLLDAVVATAELVVCSGVGDLLGVAERVGEAECDGLAEALVCSTIDCEAEADIVAVGELARADVATGAPATTLPAGAPSAPPPPAALP